MQREFVVLKDRPKLKIQLTRESVAAGDDCWAPHEREIEVRSFVDPIALLREVYPGYLPSVAGVGHTWDCYLNGTLVATVRRSQIVPHVAEIRFAPKNHMHFKYNPTSY